MKNKTNKLLAFLCILSWLLLAVSIGYLMKTTELLYAPEETEPTTEPTEVVEDLGHGLQAHGGLWVNGSKIYDARGQVTVLRGLSSHGIAWYPRYLNGSAMQELYDLGANVQRLAMYTDANHGYLREPQLNLNYLYMGIESVLAADMYVIVDWHTLEDEDPREYAQEAIEFFRAVSSHYGDHPGIIYEICNEPNGDTDWDDIQEYARQVIPVIRDNAPNALVLVGTPSYCTDLSGPMEDPLEFDNILYTLHRYIDTREYAPCDNDLIRPAVEAGLPVFVSEWGTGTNWGDTDESLPPEVQQYQSNAQPFLDYMCQNDISWTAWALSNKDEEHSVLQADCDKLSDWDDGDLTPFGKLIFGSFRQEKQQLP